MGKEYSVELRALAEIYNWALKTRISTLETFARQAKGMPLVAVGSGGSMTAAVLASVLHEGVSCPMTPLEFLTAKTGKNNAVLLISSGGKNNDILAAYDQAVKTEPSTFGIACASTGNKLTEIAADNVLVQAATPPTGRDGFLATNTLLAMSVWIARAHGHLLPGSIHSLAYNGKTLAAFRDSMSSKLSKFKDVDTLLVLYDYIGKAAAVDMESKMSEAGIVNVQLADYRNFAHGRHNWLEKRGGTTGIIVMSASTCAMLAEETMKHIPDNIPTYMMPTRHNGAAACLALLAKTMHVVDWFGRAHGIDPRQA